VSISERQGSSEGILSCVVDADPRFAAEALRWYATATRLAEIPPARLAVNLVGHDSSLTGRYLRSRGVSVQAIDAFDARSPHCNKISGALQLARQGMTGLCVLTDTDVALFEDPRTIPVPVDAVGMRPVDIANPPIRVLRKIFATARLPEPLTVSTAWQRRSRTLLGNGNGGLYLIPGNLLPTVSDAWATWARWLLDRRSLLRRWTVHVDQVAMALALAAEGIDVFDAGPRWNIPTHLGRIPDDFPAPAMVHYHGVVGERGDISMTGNVITDKLIVRANLVTADVNDESACDL
jgi:hypothetical protein